MPPLARIRLFAIAALAISAPAFARAAPAADDKKTPDTASFRFLRFTELPALCAAGVGGDYKPVEAYTGFIGNPLRLPSKKPVSLFASDKNGKPLKAGEALAPPLASFTPLDTPRQLVVLFGDAKKADARVIADTPATFPFGRVLAVNLTDKPLKIEIGGATTSLVTGNATVCAEPEKFVGADNTAVRITTGEPADTRIYSSIWTHNTAVRTMAFVYKNEAGRIIVRTILDANIPGTAEAAPEKKPATNAKKP